MLTDKQTNASQSFTMDSDLEKAISCHEEGKFEEALKLLKSSADQQHPLALYLYALSLREGWGCERDQKKAFQILQEVIQVLSEKIEIIKEKPIVTTKEMEEEGRVSVDKRPSIVRSQLDPNRPTRQRRMTIPGTTMYFLKQTTRVELIPIVIFELGICYFYGWGIEKATNIACFYFDIAASLGDPQAQDFLGYMYERGLGVKKSKLLAAKYYRMNKEAHVLEKPWILKSKYDPKTIQAVDEGSLCQKLKNVPEPERIGIEKYLCKIPFLNKI
jgi:hypothetical protein